MILKKLDRQSVLYLIIITVIAILVYIGFFYYSEWTKIEEKQEPTEKTMREIIRELTTPRGDQEPLPGGIVDDLTSSGKKEKPVSLPEGTINDLTAPE